MTTSRGQTLAVRSLSGPQAAPGVPQLSALAWPTLEPHEPGLEPRSAYLFRKTLQIPSEYLFKNLATFASVSPDWTRGTTLEGEETQHHTTLRAQHAWGQELRPESAFHSRCSLASLCADTLDGAVC